MPRRRGYAHKHAVLTLVERGGQSRSFHVDGTKAEDVLPIIKALSRWRCLGVGGRMQRSPYHGHRFPPEVIQHAVWLYLRFTGFGA